MMDVSLLGAPSMNRAFGTLFLFVVLLVPSGWSQSASDLAQKFPPHEVYEVEPGVVMSAKFAPNGLVCEMHVEQTHFNRDVVQLWDGLDMDKVNSLLDRLVPPSERGEKEQDEFSRLIAVSGPTMTKTDRYANVFVDVMWGVETHKKSVTTTSGAVLEIKWRNRSCNYLAKYPLYAQIPVKTCNALITTIDYLQMELRRSLWCLSIGG